MEARLYKSNTILDTIHSTSAITIYKGKEFSEWNGHALITSLKDKSLRKLVFDDFKKVSFYNKMIQYPKQEHVTLPSVESWGTNMNILRDPPKAVWTRRIDKVSQTQEITRLIGEDNGDRICEMIKVYPRGINLDTRPLLLKDTKKKTRLGGLVTQNK